MKIGILTYHKAQNYGAMLQAIATRFTLERMGHDAYYIDYFPRYHQKWYEANMPLLWKIKHPLRWQKFKSLLPQRLQRIQSFIDFQNIYIEPYCKPLCESYDLIIYGSDQIWRKQPTGSFNPMYFGLDGIKALKKCSYAASIQNMPKTKKDIRIFKELLKNLDRISVREKALKDFVENLGFNVEHVLDPTLLVKSNDWDNIFNLTEDVINDDYILFYSVRPNAFEKKYVRLFAEQKKMKLIIIQGNVIERDTENEWSTKSPDQLLKYIKYSKFVITDSFHGMVFAINYRKPFFVYTDFAQERIFSVLKALKLSERYIDGRKVINVTSPMIDIDYSVVERDMELLREKSISYIKDITSL